MPHRRGFAHERDLVRRFWSYGFAAVRAPASGSKVKRVVYPDVVAVYKGRVIAAEVKTIRKPRCVYIDKNRVEKLREFATRAGGSAYIAVKVVGTGEWVFVPIENLVDTGKSFKITPEMLAQGIKLEALVSTIKGVRKLTEFARKDDSHEAT